MATVLAAVRTLTSPLVQYRRHLIWEVLLDAPRPPSPWAEDERLLIIGPESLEAEMNPQLWQFLGGESAADDLKGVREGDRLMLVTIENRYVYYGYIYFDTTRETRRQKRIFGEKDGTPVIGTCYSTPFKIWGGKTQQLEQNTELSSRLQKLLPAGTDLQNAAKGFKSLGQFIYTLHVSQNLDIPFDALRAGVLSGQSLWQAIEALKPNVDAMAEVRKAWDEASIHRRVLNEAFRYLQQLGYSRVINEVMASNQASSKANVAVGMKICRELRDWTIVKRLVVQKVEEANRSDWRVFVI
jgi:hypothetical protein